MIETKEGLVFEIVPTGCYAETFAQMVKQSSALMAAGIIPDERVDTPGLPFPVSEILRRLLGAEPSYTSRHWGVICGCGEEVIHKNYLVYPFDIRASRCGKCGIVYLRKCRVTGWYSERTELQAIPDIPLWDHPAPYTGSLRAVAPQAPEVSSLSLA